MKTARVVVAARTERAHGLDDVGRGNTESFEQLVRLAAPRNLADGEPVDGDAAPATASATASPMPPLA
jgi:hypothetical protein